MEGDGADVARGDAALDGGLARGSVDGAERFDPARATTLGQEGIDATRSVDQCGEQGRREEGKVPGDTQHGGARSGRQRRVNTAEGAGAGDDITGERKAGAPGDGVGRVGDEPGRSAGDFGEEIGDAVEDPAPADLDQALGAAPQSRGLPPGQDRA